LNSIPLTDEQALSQQLVAGNEDAFATLYVLHQSAVYHFILKFVNSASMAEDLQQEVFLKVWEQRRHFAEVHNFRAYLFIIARNHTLNMLKKALRSDTAASEVINGFYHLRNPVEDQLQDKEYQAFLQKILATLPPRTREIFRRCREQGQSYEEVAHALGISRNAVKNHMVLSMKILSTAVKRDLGISLALFLTIISSHK
jgi:RNA polymerase sigma-70 factor (family 1)